MSKISEKNKIIAKAFLQEVGGIPSVREYVHDYLDLKIDVISVENQPADGVTSYGTIGLSDVRLEKDQRALNVGVELCAAIDSNVKFFPNVMASAVFSIMRSSLAPFPGACMLNCVREYDGDTNLPNLYFASPFLWEGLGLLKLKEVDVAFLLCFSISEGERLFLMDKGSDEFESLLERMDVNIFDFGRASSV